MREAAASLCAPEHQSTDALTEATNCLRRRGPSYLPTSKLTSHLVKADFTWVGTAFIGSSPQVDLVFHLVTSST